MKKIVISGSAKLSQELEKWNRWWQNAGFDVLYCPALIDSNINFSKAYKDTYERFYKSLLNSNLIFVMNEDKNGVGGYIGAQTFAEASYAIANNLFRNENKIIIVILKMPTEKVACYSEITMWLEYGWAIMFEDWKTQEGF